MKIRPANQQDIPAIIEVLKAGLGEVSSQKNEQIWRYKHIDNPFGESIVLVAEKDNRIAGVRAFMQWRWQKEDRMYTAYRAVDTATHPDFQRQGIFKTLSLQALEIARQNQAGFIFNTPNNNSLPGYLKMRWQKVDRLQVRLKPIVNLPFTTRTSTPNKNDFSALVELCNLHNARMQSTGKFFTPKSPEYLKWRYAGNPMQKYEIYADKNIYMAFYVKKHKYFNELRVSEILTSGSDQKKTARKILAGYARQNRCQIISISGYELYRFDFFGKFGPVFTVKPLVSEEKAKQQMLQIENWHYSLGDLELF